MAQLNLPENEWEKVLEAKRQSRALLKCQVNKRKIASQEDDNLDDFWAKDQAAMTDKQSLQASPKAQPSLDSSFDFSSVDISPSSEHQNREKDGVVLESKNSNSLKQLMDDKECVEKPFKRPPKPSINKKGPESLICDWRKLPQDWVVPFMSHDKSDFGFDPSLEVDSEDDGTQVISVPYDDNLHSWQRKKSWNDRYNKKGMSLLCVSIPDMPFKQKIKGKRKKVLRYLEDGVDNQKILDVLQNTHIPGLRICTELRRSKTWKDKTTGKLKTSWNIIAGGKNNPLRHCLVEDMDGVIGRDRLEKIVAAAKALHANGVVISEKKPGVFSLSVAFHFNKFLRKDIVLDLHTKIKEYLIYAIGDQKLEKFGLGLDDTGSTTWMCKNIWGFEMLENTIKAGHHFEGHDENFDYGWSSVKGKWVPRKSIWFEECEGNTLRGGFDYHTEIFDRGLVNMSDVVDSLEELWHKLNHTIKTPLDTFRDLGNLQKNIKDVTDEHDMGQKHNPDPYQDQKRKKKPSEWFRNSGRHNSVCNDVWAKVRQIQRSSETGKLESYHVPMLKKVFEETEQDAIKDLKSKAKAEGRNDDIKTLAQDGDNWIERQIESLLKKTKQEWDAYSKPATDYDTLVKIARKLLNVAFFAVLSGGESKGFSRNIVRGFEAFVRSTYFDQPFNQNALSYIKVRSTRTKYAYARLGKNFALYRTEANKIICQLEDADIDIPLIPALKIILGKSDVYPVNMNDKHSCSAVYASLQGFVDSQPSLVGFSLSLRESWDCSGKTKKNQEEGQNREEGGVVLESKNSNSLKHQKTDKIMQKTQSNPSIIPQNSLTYQSFPLTPNLPFEDPIRKKGEPCPLQQKQSKQAECSEAFRNCLSVTERIQNERMII